jgi:hypothetical protein
VLKTNNDDHLDAALNHQVCAGTPTLHQEVETKKGNPQAGPLTQAVKRVEFMC